MATTYELIASTIVGSGGASSITFMSTGNIPNTYTDLLIKLSARCNQGAETGNMSIAFNGTSANSSRRLIYGNGSTVASTNASDGYVGDIDATNSTSNTFSNTEIYIPNYLSSNYKSFSVENVTENNGSTAWSFMVAGLWSNTSAITSITLAPLSPQTWSFSQYTTAYLYGIKNS